MSFLTHVTPLLAADEGVRTIFEFARVRTTSDWVIPVAVLALGLLYVRWMYARDGHDLSKPLRWFLVGLRSLVLIGLLVVYLQPQWRAERDVVRPSRVVMMVDTSLSMGVRDIDEQGRRAEGNRAELLEETLDENAVDEAIREKHELTVLRFDTTAERVVTLPRKGDEEQDDASDDTDEGDANDADAAPETVDWKAVVAPTGVETRLGESLSDVVQQEQRAPVSAIVVISDGGQNSGETPDAAIQAAREARIPIHVIGVGSLEQAANVRVVELNAAPRAFPGDPFAVSGLIQLQGSSEGAEGSSVKAELRMVRANEDGADGGRLLGAQDVILGAGGEATPVRFEFTPEETGAFSLVLKVATDADDLNPDDDRMESDLEVIDRKDRVLLMAGGPSRDYRFLARQLFRDETVTVDVHLQSAQGAVSQEADNLLDDFPTTKEEMYEYDAVVAFDPDWSALSDAQINLLEEWVANQGGGLVVSAGPVHAGDPVGGWAMDPAMRKVRALYPVEFHQGGSVWDSRTQTSSEPWPLDLTRAGRDAEFLQIADDAVASLKAWETFPGVYSFQSIRGLKPAATELATFSDPRAGGGGASAVYLAEQFYGSGRVFYIGSGEIWRLRRDDPTYFERFFTKVIRHVSQGRLLRSSDRGIMATDRLRYIVGNPIIVRAQLTDARLEPLDVESVVMEVFGPDGEATTTKLRPDPNRLGGYLGQTGALREGTYRLELVIPDSDDERLVRRVQVRMPDLEKENPKRNEALLSLLAERTGGTYFDDASAALDPENEYGLLPLLKDRTQVRVLPMAPNRDWEGRWMAVLMAILCGLLCLEWLIRRLARMA